ncbi:MAG: YjbQ family protein [Gammaproteobacteria bacterium]|nr:YjbQ family protein [Gammaproteobacteria bacterium]
MVKIISFHPQQQGLHNITAEINRVVIASGLSSGICHLMIRHTSASLTISENADPTARADLERFLARLVPENDPLYRHTLEGSDDMPAHIKSVLTATTLAIPVLNGTLALGTWQGIYLWEHRHHPSTREVVIHLGE